MMAHDHRPEARDRNTGRLKWTLGLVVTYMAAEVVGGLAADSLALLADAGHMLSDAGSLALALFAIWIARRPPTVTKTYGFYRTEILAALANGVTLVLISLYIFYEAYQRFQDPPQVLGPLMLAVAVGGLLVNVAGLFLLRSGKDENLNMRGAWLHVMADAAGSLGAIVASILIWWRGWNIADPVVSVLIGVLVLGSSWKLLKESVSVLMQWAPAHLDMVGLENAMRRVDGVATVHHLHVWTITSGMNSLAAHVVLSGTRTAAYVLKDVREVVKAQFGVDHCTIQVEGPALEEPETRV